MSETIVLDRDIPIVDAHHHLWDDARSKYMFDDYYADINGSGHNIVASLYADCRSMYRASGPAEFRPVGEVEFARGCAAIGASGQYGPTRICAGIVGHADLLLGDRVAAVLERQVEAGGGRFHGIRHILATDPDVLQQAPPDILEDGRFRDGFARLQDLGLAFDAWLYHPQLDEFARFAAGFPRVPIILNHIGGLIGIGRFASRKGEAFAQWKASLGTLARLPNISIKLGALTMPVFGMGLEEGKPHGYETVAARIRPLIETCIEIFGTRRCIFESNFPVNRDICSYGDIWNAYKHIVRDCSRDEKLDLFGENALRIYGVDRAFID